jgi:hypothetical protein
MITIFGKKIGVFDSKQSKILKKLIITLVFKKNANFLPKIFPIFTGKKCMKNRPLVTLLSHCPHPLIFVNKLVCVVLVYSYFGDNRLPFLFFCSPVSTLHYSTSRCMISMIVLINEVILAYTGHYVAKDLSYDSGNGIIINE